MRSAPRISAGGGNLRGGGKYLSLLIREKTGRDPKSGPLCDPRRHQVGDVLAVLLRILEVMRAGDKRERLVLRRDRLMDRARIRWKYAHVREALHHKRRHGELLQMRRALALRGLEAPHRQPRAQRRGPADAERSLVRARRIARIAAG